MKEFFKDFKDFIAKGDVMSMAVGIIVGSAFTAIVTAVSATPKASFAKVLAVQGATMRASSRFLGPMGSTWGMVCQISRPQSPCNRYLKWVAVPKRVVVS